MNAQGLVKNTEQTVGNASHCIETMDWVSCLGGMVVISQARILETVALSFSRGSS